MKTKAILFLVVLFISASPAMALVQYKDGQIHNINSQINDDVWVDYSEPGVKTTINMPTGGTIPSPYKLKAYNDSRINISGGLINTLTTYDNSQVIMSSGSVPGTSLYGFNAYNNSKIIVSGGSVFALCAFNNSQVIMSGGTINSLQAYDNSQITIMEEASVSELSARPSGRITILDGSVSSFLQAYGNSQVIMSGGTIGSELLLFENAEMTISGSDFNIDGSPFGFGDITSIFGGGYNNEPYRRITGTLVNGDTINTIFRIGNSASITLVPEPSTITLLITSLVASGLYSLRRKK